ncbi:unnamed protein product [Hymenolepis diminuta]|uniref:Uncharacterized protein n=1 Tax=Hymenolepis diminuta TaxID=6216 RepID=A0A564YYS9_HYMDI|nr:unnamed protein product [Hymenolepis diminuta]
MEQIGIPSQVPLKLPGGDEQGKTELKCPLMHKKWFKKHPWHIIKPSVDVKPTAPFMKERTNSIRNLTSKILPHVSDSRESSKVGNLKAKDGEQACSSETSNSEILEVNELVTSSGDTLTESIITPRGSLDLSVDDEFGGPSLLINDVLIPLSIENKNSVFEIVSLPQFELCFKSLDSNPRHQGFKMKNNGTEDLTYHWKRVQSTLGGILPPRESSFYFFTNQNKIEAGDSKTIRISFQSTTEGVFSETWELYIESQSLHSASPIMFHFSGVFFRSDEEGKNQPNITEQIQEQITCKMAKEIVEDVINSIAWNKPKILLNNDAMTATESFEKYNPGVVP